MRSKFRYYVVVWLVLVAIFNVIVFVTPNEIGEMDKFGGSFWIGYLFIICTFIGQLGVVWFSLKGSAEKTFYHIPLLSISYGTLIAMLIMGTLCMVIPDFPIWLGIILCMLVLVFSIISMAQAEAAGSMVEEVGMKIKSKTFFMKSLILDIDSLSGRSTVQEITDEIKKIYEVVRYSDPMSHAALTDIESQITLKMDELAEGVQKSDVAMVEKISKEIQILLRDRNKKCRLLK